MVPLRWDPVGRRETTLCYVQPFNARTLLAYYHIVLHLAIAGCYDARVFYPAQSLMNTELSIHDGKYYYFVDFAWPLFC